MASFYNIEYIIAVYHSSKKQNVSCVVDNCHREQHVTRAQNTACAHTHTHIYIYTHACTRPTSRRLLVEFQRRQTYILLYGIENVSQAVCCSGARGSVSAAVIH